MTPGGRPKTDQPRKPRGSIWLNDDEDALIAEAVALDDATRSVWVREQLVAAAKRRIARERKSR